MNTQKSKKLVEIHIIRRVDKLVETCIRSVIGNSQIPTLSIENFQNFDGEDVPIEFWMVSDWLAEKLVSNGEIVSFRKENDLDLNIWGRTQSDLALHDDDIIQYIAENSNLGQFRSID